MNMDTKNKRNLGIDLLRAIAMFLVIIWHFIGQGGLLEYAESGSAKYWILSFVQILTCCCVNLYGLTTGYVMCDKPFRMSRVTKLWMTTVFWSVAVSCVFFALVPESRTISEMVSMFLPILRGRYWFFIAYVVVMLLSPALNLVIRSLTKGQFHLLIAVLFLLFGVIPVGSLGYDVMRISTGHHFSWMIVLYIVGGYLRRFVHGGGDKQEALAVGLRWFCTGTSAISICGDIHRPGWIQKLTADLSLSFDRRRSHLPVPVFQGFGYGDLRQQHCRKGNSVCSPGRIQRVCDPCAPAGVLEHGYHQYVPGLGPLECGCCLRSDTRHGSSTIYGLRLPGCSAAMAVPQFGH